MKFASFFNFLGISQTKEKEQRMPHVAIPQQGRRYYSPDYEFTEKDLSRKLENIKGEQVYLTEECVRGSYDWVITPLRLLGVDNSNKYLENEDGEDVCPCCNCPIPHNEFHKVYIKYDVAYACENSTIGPAYYWDGDGIYDTEEMIGGVAV